MKILGISFGTRNGNSETLIKEALMGAEELGAEVELIRYMDYDIKAINESFDGTDPDTCTPDDDFALLEDRIYAADGLILGSPMYSWGPTDGYRILCDRLNGRHNIEALRARGLCGDEEKLDQRIFKTRVAGLITVGGTKEFCKTITTIPLMHVLTYSMNIHVVDHVICEDTGAPGGVIYHREKVKHSREMGKRVALTCGKPPESISWQGPESGICPHCHNDLVNFRSGGRTFECVVCGVSGTLSWEGEKLIAKVALTADNLPRKEASEMQKLACELEALKQDWETKKDSYRAKIKEYENLPIPITHAK